MKPKTLILLGIAITCGLGASYMTSRLLAERNSEPDKITILVPKKDLNISDQIKTPQDLFEPKEYLRGTEPPNYIDNFETLKNRVVKRSCRAGVPITNDDLYGVGEQQGLWSSIAKEYRAVGIRVNMEEIAGGFASLPGSRVDLISTVRRGDDKSTYSQVLLEDVLVIAADTQMHRDEAGRAMPANVVTVAVKPEDALRIKLGQSLGSLSLILRKIGDNSKVNTSYLTAESLKTGKSESAEVEPAPPAPKVVEQPKQEPQVAKAEPRGRLHVMRIREGEHTRQTEFLLDARGEVILPEGSRAELAPPRPQRGEPLPAPQSDEDQ